MADVHLSLEDIMELTQTALEGAGASSENAASVASTLITTNYAIVHPGD